MTCTRPLGVAELANRAGFGQLSEPGAVLDPKAGTAQGRLDAPGPLEPRRNSTSPRQGLSTRGSGPADPQSAPAEQDGRRAGLHRSSAAPRYALNTPTLSGRPLAPGSLREVG